MSQNNINGKKIYKLAQAIYPICRSITGKGNRKTLRIIKKIIPNLKIHEIKSGTKVFDWKIPNEWNPTQAYIVDPNKKKIVDFKNNNLHLVSYSIPINKKISLKYLKRKLHFNKKMKNAIPYVCSYYNKDW